MTSAFDGRRDPAADPPAPGGAGLGSARPFRRVLVVTNDFPPRLGGIQSFVHNLLLALPRPSDILVYTSDFRGAKQFDAEQPFEVIRDRSRMLLPTPRVRRNVIRALGSHRAEAVWFGAAAPLGLLAPALRAAGAHRIVATTHGHEVGWAALPVARTALRRIATSVDTMTYLGEYTRVRLSAVVGGRVDLARLAPGVDTALFNPAVDATEVRERHGLGPAPVVSCVSRLVPRKGQDTLIDGWPCVLDAVPDARLLIVGSGPYSRELQARAERVGVAASVVFTGGVSARDLPAYVRAGDVFAMPCRTRRHGLDVEGLGIVYLEASACGRPVVAGDSGGAPDAVLAGQTGFVVPGGDPDAAADRIIELLKDGPMRERMGGAGRNWVQRDWQWPAVAGRLEQLLQS